MLDYMANRNHIFEIDEYYHCYNRGCDKRIVFADAQDYAYFLRSVAAYNSSESLGKLRLHSDLKPASKLVEIISYCLLPNHYHLILMESVENGISDFMRRVSGGYTMYFNAKYKRSGSLFQGKFKSKHIDTDQNLRQVTSYVSHNNLIHKISDPALFRSGLNTDASVVRGWTSNDVLTTDSMREVVEIIREQRISFD